jgi:hypothetical protein
MDYIIINTQYDSDNVELSTSVLQGRIESWINLTQKTYSIFRKGSNIPTTESTVVWDDLSIPQIQIFIGMEIERVELQLLLEKTRLYEITYYSNAMKIQKDETPQMWELAIQNSLATIAYLKNYIP